MRRNTFVAAMMAGVCALSSASLAQTVQYYETFENFVQGGPGSTSWGTDATSTAWVHPFGGNADLGFFDVAGYTDDAASAVQFSSLQNDTMQNTDTGEASIGGATKPFALSFALKLDDNSTTTGGFVQLIAANTFFSSPGFRTMFQVQIWGPDFLAPSDPSYFVVTPFDSATGNPLLSSTGVPNILTGTNGFSADGSAWNIVILVCDPDNTTMRAWVNPTSTAASPDINSTTFGFGSADAPHFLSIGAYTFLADSTPTTEQIVTIDSVKIISGGTDLNALFSAAYNSYSTLPGASGVENWEVFE